MGVPARTIRELERHAREGRWDEAAKLVREATRGAKPDVRLLLRHITLLEPTNAREALRQAQRAVELAPQLPAVRAIAARAALVADEPALASEHAEKALAREPEQGLARTLRHLAAMRNGAWAEGISGLLRDPIFEERSVVGRALVLLLSRWRELGPVAPPLPEAAPRTAPEDPPVSVGPRLSARTFYSAARTAYSDGDGSAMLAAAAGLRSLDPDDPDGASAYAAAYHLCGEHVLAERWVRTAIAQQRAKSRKQEAPEGDSEDGAEPETVLLAASIALESGDLAQAARLAAAASPKVNPFDRWEARLVLAQALIGQERTDAALRELEQAYSEEPCVLALALNRVAGHGFLVAARRLLLADQPPEAGRALRAAMCRVLSAPRRLTGDRRLRALVGILTGEADDLAAVRAFAEKGLRP